MSNSDIDTRRNELSTLIQRVSNSEVNAFANAFRHAMARGARVFLFGNGGSAALSAHFAIDLLQLGLLLEAKRGFMPVALSTNDAMITASANDWGYEQVFESQLKRALVPGDVVVAISCSGRSPNVLRALDVAANAQAEILVLTGAQGSALKDIATHSLIVESDDPYIIESVHLAFSQLIAVSLKATSAESEAGVSPREVPMSTRPTEEDQRKLHLEINQIMNQRFTLTTGAVALFAGMLSWAAPRQGAEIQLQLSRFTYSVCVGLLVVLLCLFLVHFTLRLYARVLTTYLKESAASVWEDDWKKFRQDNFYVGYSGPQSLLFGLLGILTALYPYLLANAYGVAFESPNPPLIVLGMTYAFIVFMLWYSEKAPKFENRMARKWREVLQSGKK